MFGNSKTEEERMREQAAIQDSVNTGNIEQQAIAQKQKDREKTNNQLFDVESARTRIRQGLLGYKEKLVQRKNQDTGDIQTEKVKVKTRDKKLCNQDAAALFIDEANTFLNHNTISTYLPASTIENKCKGTIKQIHRQIVGNWHKYDIESPEDASEIVSIIRNPMIDATNKARGGRLIQNQEKIRVEKESVSREGGSDSDDESGGVGDLF